MASSLSDQYLLSTDPGFQHRVQASLVNRCVIIATEAWSFGAKALRKSFAAGILSSPVSQANYVALFSNSCATDTLVIADATQAGTVVLTTGNLAAQAALVTDAHIDAAISGQFNTFIREPD
jgi:hypothetical protein